MTKEKKIIEKRLLLFVLFYTMSLIQNTHKAKNYFVFKCDLKMHQSFARLSRVLGGAVILRAATSICSR